MSNRQASTMYRWGRRLADFEVGRTYEHPWEVTIDAGTIALLQASFLDATTLYSSAAYARELGFRDRPLSPLLCLNLALSFSAHDVVEQAPLDYVDVRFPEAGYPGDTVQARSTVLGCTRAASGDGGVVHVRTVLENEHGHVLCVLETKVLVQAGSLAERPAGTALTERPTQSLSSQEQLPSPLRQSRAYAPRSTLPGLAEDFTVGQVFVHEAGKTVGENEHVQLARLLRNPVNTRVVHGGLVLAWALSLTSRDVTGHALWDLGLVNGAHPSQTVGGDTLYALCRVEAVRLDGATADITLRIVAVKNETGADAWAAHGEALFVAEVEKPAHQKLEQKVVEVTRTLRVPRTVKGQQR